MDEVKNYVTTRDVYKAVKKFDHRQFDAFCTKVYKNGFMDGRESVKAVEVSELLDAVGDVKGVGPALHGRIKDAVEQKFKDRKEAEE